MEIKEKTNIIVYLVDETDNYYILSNATTFDYGNPNPYIEPDGYVYFLPKLKSCFEFQGQDQELIVFVERVNERRKQVYVSQTNWLFMRNIIEERLGLNVKILKRYPGKVTVARLRIPGQEVNKVALKTLAKEMREKIYIKPAR